MKELNEYREALINKLAARANEFRSACLAVADPFAPLEAGGWNAHQLACHTRDVDKMVYGSRAKRTLTEDNPAFQNFDGDAYVRDHYSRDEPLRDMLNGFVQSVEELATLLRAQPAEAWARTSSHEKLGAGLTLQLWVERGLAHIEEHLATLTATK